MSMLRYLTAPGGKSKLQLPARGSLATVASSAADGKPKLKLHVPNYGMIYLPPPDTSASGESVEPRDDAVMYGELELTLPMGYGTRRCKAIRVGFRTVLTLDLGSGRKFEEDVLFERKVEIIGSNADGMELFEGSQRFQFTIIIPANLASHDWHTNGVISHILFAEVEGQPEANDWGMARVGSASSLFGLRRSSRQGSASGSRGTSPVRSSPAQSPPASPRMASSPSRSSFSFSPTERSQSIPYPQVCGAQFANALANLNINGQNGGRSTSTIGESSRLARSYAPPFGSPPDSPLASSPPSNDFYPNYTKSISITRQVPPLLPRAPSYDASEAEAGEAEWLSGTLRTKRNCMIVYNPSPTGGVNELSERMSGYIGGLGVWELQMVSDVWTICALLSVKVKLSSLSAGTTVFSIKLSLNQTHSILSPRDEDAEENRRVSTRTFPVLEVGKRPPTGYNYPDRGHAALWRGSDAGGPNDPTAAPRAAELDIDQKCRLPNDNVARPSTLLGVVTPIHVSHSLVLEVAFSVWGEDDLGKKMENPTHGGLRVLKVSRPVGIPSCCLMPAVLNLPSYESHANDPLAPPPEQMPSGLPGWEWCACGWKIEELEARMRQSVVAQQADIDAAVERAARAASISGGTDGLSSQSSLANGSTRSSDEDKIWAERGRQGSR